MAITLKQAFALNGTPDLDSFNDLQEQCKNTSYFSDSKPINHLSSWEGYWYGAGYDLSISLSTTSVAATGGTITVTYTIKEHRSTGDVLVSGIKPTVTSTVGTVSNITTTNTSGVGTATITIDNNKSLSSKSVKVTVSSTLGGSVISKESTATQSAGYYTYGSITINTFTYGAVGAAGGTSSPSITYSQPYGWNGSTSGAGTINGNGDDDYTTYKETGEHSALTVNESTGVVTWTKNNATANTVDASRSGKITATVTRNGKTATKEVTTTQNAEKISSYGAWSFTVKANTSSIAATGGSVTFTISRPTRTVTYDTGDTQTQTATSGTFALTRSNTSFTLSTTSISMTSSSLPTFTLSVGATGAAAVAAISSTVTAAFTATDPTTGTKTKSVTSSAVTRAASSLISDEYKFSTFSVAKSSFTAATGTTTLSMVVQKRSKYTGNQYSSWATITPASGTLSVTAGTGGSVSSITYGTTSTCTITVAQYTNTTTNRTITISGNYNSGKATSSLDLSQKKDAIINTSYSDVTAGTISNKTIPASGTTTNYTATAGNGSQVLTYTWASGKANTTETKSITPSHSSISATAESRGTTISNKTTVKSQNVTWTGLDGTKKATGTMYIYLAGNYVTKVAPSISVFSYSSIGAGATSASPTVTNGNTTFTFTSGSTTTTTPSATYGTLSVSNAYTLASSQNGFTKVDSSTGVLTATSRGTTYGASPRSSSNVTLTRSATWTIKSGYGSNVSGNVTKTASCSQAANTITIQSVTSTPGTITNTSFTAGTNTKDVSATGPSASAVLKYSSGSEVTTSYNNTDYGTWAFGGYYSTSSQTWATINSSAYNRVNVTAATRGTTEGSSRTATLTRTERGFTFTLKSDYGGASKTSASTSCTCTLTQAENKITAVSLASAVSSGTIMAVNAAGGTVTWTPTVTYSSGSTSSDTSKFTPTYTIANYASLTDTNSLSLDASTSNYNYKQIGGSYSVASGEKFLCTIGSATVTSGSPSGYRILAYDLSQSQHWGTVTLTDSSLAGILTTSAADTLEFIIYAGINGATSGIGVKYDNICISRMKTTGSGATQSGNKTTWASLGTTVGGRNAAVTVSIKSTYTTTAVTTTAYTAQAYNGVASTEYGNYKTTISLANATPTCSSGTTTATIKTYRQARSKYTSGSYGSYGSDTLATVGTPTVSESVNWLSLGTVSNSSTGTYTATVTYNANSKNTSTREATLTATANSVSGTVKLTQGKDSYTDSGGVTSTTYGNWGGGAISFNSTTALSAAADSRTVTIQPWSRTKTVKTTAKIREWKCGGTETLATETSTNSTEYYTGKVAVSENGSYTSLSATSYTASSSAKTLTLTKTTCGATITSAATVTVTANPSTDGPATTTKSISQTANALTKVAISVKSGTTPIPHGGGTVTLQCKGTFTSGTHEVTPSWTGVTNGTLSSTTAKNPTLTVGANSGAERNVTVSAKYPNDSTGKTASFTIKQAGVPVNFTLPIDFYVQSTRGVSGAADCSFKCSGEVALGSQSPQAFSFNSGLIREYYHTSGSFKESKVLNLASLNVTTNTTNFNDYRLDWGFALHASGGYGSSTSSTIQYKMYWQIEKYDGTIYELMSTSYPKTSTNYVSVDYLTTNESQTQSTSPVSIANGDRIRITIVI